MALTATHLRFALEMKDEIGVQNLEQYLSGTMYPDSRYFTGVAREVTHGATLFAAGLATADDFRKGWAMHLACDLAQAEAMKALFPEEWEKNDTMPDRWIFRTALKVLQDIDDAGKFDADHFVRLMTWYASPFGHETSEQLESYYGFYRELYASGAVTIEDELAAWRKVGMDADMLERVKEKSYQLKENPSNASRVSQLFAQSLESYRSTSHFEVQLPS